MSNLLKNTAKLAFNIIHSYIDQETIAVDATCGNGHDTMSLIEAGCKHIYAFDIQKSAIDNTKKLLIDNHIDLSNVSLINDSHINMSNYVPTAKVIMFNLGYLPGSDKSIVTTSSSTLSAVKNALSILDVNGICSIAMYSGHLQGKEEKETLIEMVKNLDKSIFHVAYINFINQPNNPPELLLITKKKGLNNEN